SSRLRKRLNASAPEITLSGPMRVLAGNAPSSQRPGVNGSSGTGRLALRLGGGPELKRVQVGVAARRCEQPLARRGFDDLAVVSDGRVVALGQARNEGVGVGGAGGRLDLFARGVRAAVGDVLGDGHGEEERLLRHQPDLLPKALDLHVADVVAVEGDAAAPG